MSFLFFCWPMLASIMYALFWLPRSARMAPVDPSGCDLASGLTMNSPRTLSGKRAHGVLTWLFRMKSTGRYCEKKWGVPIVVTALVKLFGAKTQLVPPVEAGRPWTPPLQPGPSPGDWPTENALALSNASILSHFKADNDAVVDQNRPSCSFVEACPPMAYESLPPEASLNSNCIPITVKF